MIKDDQTSAHSNNPPATQQDIQILMSMIGQFEQKFYDLREEISESEERMKAHFDLAVETIRHDLVGANKDDIQNIKQRVKRLEEEVGIAA